MMHMVDRTDRQTLQGDRGDVPAWPMVAILLAVVMTVVATESIVHGLSAPGALLLFVESLGGLVVLVGLLGVSVLVGDWVRARRRRALDWQMGPVLRELMDVDQIKDHELTQWRRCQRKGITVEQVRQWARDGLPDPLLLASPRLAVEQESVRALADVMASAGAWDGHDRRRLIELIGFHVQIGSGGLYPVLGRWLAFPQDTVRERVAHAVAHADADQYFIVEDYRATAAAEATLYDLEDEHGIKGYRQRPQRPVHESWLARG